MCWPGALAARAPLVALFLFSPQQNLHCSSAQNIQLIALAQNGGWDIRQRSRGRLQRSRRGAPSELFRVSGVGAVLHGPWGERRGVLPPRATGWLALPRSLSPPSLSLSLSLCLRCIICTAMACDVLGGRRLCSGRRPDRFRPTWCAERACRILLWCGPPRQGLSWRTFALRKVVSLVPVRPQMAVAVRPRASILLLRCVRLGR